MPVPWTPQEIERWHRVLAAAQVDIHGDHWPDQCDDCGVVLPRMDAVL